MVSIERIKLDDTYYYVYCNVTYEDKKPIIKDYNDMYLGYSEYGILAKKIGEAYNYEKVNKRYGDNCKFIDDCLFIYDNMRFISGISDCYYNDNKVVSTTYITREELDKYIKENNIKLKNYDKFILSNELTWDIE